MYDFKLLFLLALTCQTFKMNTCDISVLAPIRGLFNRQSEPLTRHIFNYLVGMKRGYYGNEVYADVMEDGYSTSLQLCDDTSEGKGVPAILDARPSYGICDNVCLICNRLNITHLSLAWEPPETTSQDLFTFSYHPPPEIISKAYAAHIKKMNWDRFSILYEDEGSFIRLQEVINTWRNDLYPIYLKKLDYYGDNKETFKHIFKVARLSYHIIDCEADHILKYLEEIQQVENYTVYQSILLTSLDAYTVNMESLDHGPSVTTWHLTRLEDNDKWKDFRVSEKQQKKVETALAVDALNHFETAIRVLKDSKALDENSMQESDNNEENIGFFGEPPSVCYRETKEEFEAAAWPMGLSLRDALLQTVVEGFTGKVQFDENGKRINFEVHYSKLNTESRYVYVGKWDSATDKISDINRNPVTSVKSNTVVKVVTKEGKPYFIPSVNGSDPKGYVVDLMDAIFELIRANEADYRDLRHTIELGPDNKYGNPIEGSRRWDGLIGELLEHRAGFAVCDLTVTSDRNAVVDFSIPFMSLGISMLAKVDEVPDPDMFSFVNPLSTDVWLYLAVVYIVVSLVLLICARMSQDDWVNPHPCNRNPENLENIWSLYNCMWLTMGSIMTQGCDILPRGYGSRWITGTWYFFALIVTASYTANMSTFISNSRRSNNIKSVNDLAEQTEVSYGALYNGSTYKFFKTTNDTVYQKIWQVMNSANPTVFTNTNEEGKERVIRSNGKFVFFMESTSIEYFIKQDCRLKMVGSKLDSKDYGIAMPKNSPFRHIVNKAILNLQESGKLTKLKDKWWVKEDPEPQEGCEKFVVSEGDDSGSVQMKNTSGIFLVLGCGGILGFIVSIIAFFLHAHEICVQEKLPFKQVLANEWRASLDPRVLIKPVAAHSIAGSTKSPSPVRERSQSRAVSVAKSFINFNEIY